MSERSFQARDVQHDILSNYIAITSQIHVEGRNDEMRSSPIRRTFCLIVLFDLVICVLAWILRIEIADNKITFKTEVMDYKFTISLFDTVILATVRFIFLEVMYGGVKSSLPWWIALSTAVSSVFVIAKMLISYLMSKQSNGLDLIYCIIVILTFLLCWVETIFLVCRMLPKERAAREISEHQRSLSGHYAASTQSLISTNPLGSEAGNRSSPSPSIDDEQFYSSVPTRVGSPNQIRKQEINSMAFNLHSKSMDILRDTSGWTYAAGDAVQGCVTSKEIMSYRGKIFKIEVLLGISAKILYNDMVLNCEQSPVWNPHVSLVKKIETVSDNIDILYNVTNEALKGYVSPRDFVLLRTWKPIGEGFLISMNSIVHIDYPEQEDIVRGDYGLGVLYMENTTEDMNQCKYTMIVNSDIKGKVFRSLVDRGMPGILLEIISGLRQHCTTLDHSA